MVEVEHTHKDGTKHKHEGGDKPHTHEKKTSSCACNEEIGRNIYCKSHGDPDKIWQNFNTVRQVYIPSNI